VSDKTPIVYLDGLFLPLSEARIPVMDRGFLFGDGVYEMLPVYDDWVCRRDEHLERLERSLKEIDVPNPHSMEEWGNLIGALMERNRVSCHRSVYIQVTRGVDDRDHFYDVDRLSPTVFMLCRPLADRDYSDGVSAITHPDIRWGYCHIKATSLLPAVLLKNRAREAGCLEAILIRDGAVTEGASSNVFIVTKGRIKTPGKGNDLLSGITRDLVMELLDEAGTPCEEERIGEEELRGADEIWITSSTMEIAPVVRLDGGAVGKGVPGPAWRRARELYETFKQNAPLVTAQ
jgi:D-alanine transaminase